MTHFYTMHFYLLILSFLGTLFAIAMNILDYNNKHIMNKVIQADDPELSSSNEDSSLSDPNKEYLVSEFHDPLEQSSDKMA